MSSYTWPPVVTTGSAGTVTSVDVQDVSSPQVFTSAGGPVTSSGTIALTLVPGVVALIGGVTGGQTIAADPGTMGSLKLIGTSADSNFLVGTLPSPAPILPGAFSYTKNVNEIAFVGTGDLTTPFGFSTEGAILGHKTASGPSAYVIADFTSGSPTATIQVNSGASFSSLTIIPTLGILNGTIFFNNQDLEVQGALLADVSINPNNGITGLTGLAGTLFCQQPFQGSAYKKVVLYLSGFSDTDTQVFSFPRPFTNPPFAYGSSSAIAGMTVTNTDVKFTVTLETGFVFLEGY